MNYVKLNICDCITHTIIIKHFQEIIYTVPDHCNMNENRNEICCDFYFNGQILHLYTSVNNNKITNPACGRCLAYFLTVSVFRELFL